MQKLKCAVKKIVKKNIKTPEKLLEYVEKSGTKVPDLRLNVADTNRMFCQLLNMPASLRL